MRGRRGPLHAPDAHLDASMNPAEQSELPRASVHVIRDGPASSRRGRVRALALLVVHVLVALHVAHWLSSGRTLSALEPSEAGETLLTGAVNAGFVLLVLLLVSTLVLGRFFCGWACHVVAYQDACAWLLGRLGLRPKPIRSRALAMVPLLAAAQMFVLPSLLDLARGGALPAPSWHLRTDDLWARFPGAGIATLTFVVCGGLVVWLLGAKGFCTYGCPYGALFGLGDRLARGRIRVSDACEGCGHCTAVCTSNVRVHAEVARFRMVVDPNCMKCMDCVSACPKEALSFGFGPARPRGATVRAYDFSWSEELLLAASFLGGLYAFRGLYDVVPFLLAIGLALLCALSVVALVRLVRSRDVLLQHWRLRGAGRLRPAGFAFGGLFAALLALAAHSATVQVLRGRGEHHLAAAAAAPRGSAGWRAALDACAAALGRAQHLGLIDSATLSNQLGQVEAHRGNPAAARAHLERALALAPDNESARVFLLGALLALGDQEALLTQLEALAARSPNDPYLRSTLARLLERAPDSDRARALARALSLSGVE